MRFSLTIGLAAVTLIALTGQAALVPLPVDHPLALDKIRVDNPAVLPLAGTWKFQIAHGHVIGNVFSAGDGVKSAAKPLPSNANDFARPTFDDSQWANIPVPANWEMEGFSKPTYNEPDNAVGLYRRVVDVPASFGGERVIWHFDGVYCGAEVFVNGKFAGYHESGFSAFDVDVSQLIKAGEKNTLALRVSKMTTSSPLDSGDYWALGGIYRENYLVAVPNNCIDDITIVTSLDSNYTDATLKLNVFLKGTAGDKCTLTGQILNIDGTPVAVGEIKQPVIFNAAGTATLDTEQAVKSPRLWSAEKPNLYYLMLTLRSGDKVVERVQERFGFKSIEIKKGVLLWNGVAIKATGTCRHEEWAALGHALTEEAWQTDVAMMKAANINAVRTSHYNHAQRFLELCDEKGLYILDEAAGCWAPMNDISLTPGMVCHTQEMYARDKNRPCVLAWSIGNESGVGPVNKAALAWIKDKDVTRPAFISQASPSADPRIDFEDHHYPSPADLKKYAADKARATTPVIITEQPHLYYGRNAIDYDPGFRDYWAISLKNTWDVIWKSETNVGSFVWEWQDQGIADKFNDDGRDHQTNLRGDNLKGLVDGYRRPKPELYQVKMVYSPVLVEARDFQSINGKVELAIENRYSFTDLAELTCKWYARVDNRNLSSGEQKIPLAPRSSGQVVFNVPDGAESLRLEFVHPDGRTVYTTSLERKGVLHPSPVIEQTTAGTPRIKASDKSIQITTGTSVFVVDKTTGQIHSWKAGEQTFITAGPILNLGEARNPGGALRAKNFLLSNQPPQLKNVLVTAKSTDDRAVVAVDADVYLAESPDKKGIINYTFGFDPTGRINVKWKLTWTASDANAWELGLKFELPSGMTQMQWRRDTIWTDYPPGYLGEANGRVQSTDISFRSTKRDIQWMTISVPSAPADLGLTVMRSSGPDQSPLHMRARAGDTGVMLFTSVAVEPPKNHNESTPELDIHLNQNQTYEGHLTLQISKSK